MYNIAVVGATGLVGQTMLKVLEERNFPVQDLFPVASSRSASKKIVFKGKEYRVEDLANFDIAKADIALFSAGGKISRLWAPEFAKRKVKVIDNSSAWRMEKNIPLIVPEINGSVLDKKDYIIANPNCSTIQMVMALKPLHDRYRLQKVVVSTYQSVTGAGYKGIRQLEEEIRSGKSSAPHFPHPIAYNCLPHIGSFGENGYTDEEMKMINETRKILNDNSISISPTTVRLPVTGGHSEAIYAECKEKIVLEEVYELWKNFPGITIEDDPANSVYPMPISGKDKDEVFVGRLRKDPDNEFAVNFWVVSDNLRKGAATNAVQIAELLVKNSLL